ncbi:MAG: hypothetical protein OXC48_10125 [Endozoicomonadaceae bacterium]|nr:hypothetical protein [Endozoicomonadaceae bacterium]
MDIINELSAICDKVGRSDQQEKTQGTQQVTIKKIIPKLENTAIEGKHIAKRKTSQWPFYGDSKVWDNDFEQAVLEAVSLINGGILESTALISHFEKKRHEIAFNRGNSKSEYFGLRRDDPAYFSGIKSRLLSTTPLYLTGAYGYALKRAFMLPYDGEHYLNKQNETGAHWIKHFQPFSGVLKYGLVQGKIKGRNIPLTELLFSLRIGGESKKFFGEHAEDYMLTEHGYVSGVWLHPDWKIIPECIAYIDEMIQKCLHGDLTFIPRIHWWYVHLAPTWRGSGGIAEMLTNTLCRLHGVDLPPWKDGVAPSVEVLLEPNEEKFCLNYHQLFENNQQELKTLFTVRD